MNNNNNKSSSGNTFIIILVLLLLLGSCGGGDSSSSSSNSKTCGSCHRTFTNSADKRSISLRNMCENCYDNFKWSQDALDGYGD